jgi:mRNA interferase MazF
MAKPPGTAAYVPDRGDIVWLDFDPQAGHEQAGHRPALVLSPAAYNAKVGLLVACPMTTRPKGYPFEVLIAGGVPSAVLADQVKSLDWRARGAVFKGRASANEVLDVRKKLRALI